MNSRTFLLCLFGVLIASPSPSFGRVIKPSRKHETIVVDGRVHSPAEITKLIDQSTLAYVVEPIVDSSGPRAAVPRNGMAPLAPSDFERNRVSTPPDTIVKLMQLGDKAAAGKHYAAARLLYHEAFTLDTLRHTALERIAHAFASEQVYDSSVFYYQWSVRLFPLDFETHYRIGNAYRAAGDAARAVKELTIAHVLNPNDTIVHGVLKSERAQAGRAWRDWAFSPRYRIIREGQAVRVQSDTSCIGYALVKALWASEPGYAAAMQSGSPSATGCNLAEEEEALMLQAASDPSPNPIKQVVADGLTKEYVLYEIALPRDPKAILSLDWPTVLRVADYVGKYH